jgi:hypothetical protein
MPPLGRIMCHPLSDTHKNELNIEFWCFTTSINCAQFSLFLLTLTIPQIFLKPNQGSSLILLV